MKAKLSDPSMALESTGLEDEHISRFDRDAGEMVSVDAEVLRSVEEDPDYEGSDLPDWQRKEVETARALLADNGTRFIGRACQYREPWPRADCMARKLHCADGREFLCDTLDNFSLDQNVIDHPPVILWPEAKQNADVPADVQKLLAAIVR